MTDMPSMRSRPSGPKPSHRSPRVHFGSQVAVKAKNRPNETGIVKNLSEGGVLLLSTFQYSPGTELVVFLPLDLGNRKTLCMVSGKIVRIESARAVKEIQGYGIQFDTVISKSSKQLLQDFVTLKTTGKAPDRRVISRRLSPNRD